MRMDRQIFLSIQALVMVGLFLPAIAAFSTSNDVTLETQDACKKAAHRIYHGHVTAKVPPDMRGDWTSPRCEVRPGPEFLLRHYTFNSSHFQARQYYYNDPECSEPVYNLVAMGTYQVYGASWTMVGATELDYHLTSVQLTPYTSSAAKTLSTRINATCPRPASVVWPPDETQEIYRYHEFEDEDEGLGPIYDVDKDYKDNPTDYVYIDRDCTSPLYFSLHELQLVRLEEHVHSHGARRELYLGDIHTNHEQRLTYRPTTFQTELLHIKTKGCHTCQKLASASTLNPPSLPSRHYAEDLILDGVWFSDSCEAQSSGLFLTRRLKFEDNTWLGTYYYYEDALCNDPSMTVHAGGLLKNHGQSDVIAHAYNVDFLVQSVDAMIQSEGMVNVLNDIADSCGASKWQVGVRKDLTDAGGCDTMGISVPSIEYELLRVEINHGVQNLHLGQKSTDLNDETRVLRPTSFGSTLVRCSDDQFVPPGAERLRISAGSSVARFNASLLLSVIFAFVISTNFFTITSILS